MPTFRISPQQASLCLFFLTQLNDGTKLRCGKKGVAGRSVGTTGAEALTGGLGGQMNDAKPFGHAARSLALVQRPSAVKIRARWEVTYNPRAASRGSGGTTTANTKHRGDELENSPVGERLSHDVRAVYILLNVLFWQVWQIALLTEKVIVTVITFNASSSTQTLVVLLDILWSSC